MSANSLYFFCRLRFVCYRLAMHLSEKSSSLGGGVKNDVLNFNFVGNPYFLSRFFFRVEKKVGTQLRSRMIQAFHFRRNWIDPSKTRDARAERKISGIFDARGFFYSVFLGARSPRHLNHSFARRNS